MTCSIGVTLNSHRYNNGREINAETWQRIYENIGAGGFFLTEDHICKSYTIYMRIYSIYIYIYIYIYLFLVFMTRKR